ncbi:MAG: NfeD family protein [Candidatus Binatia bacterium]|nr:NfeD family protein [Candidatus Binatia bacterium]
MPWWIWILIGLSLFVIEVFIPTDFFMFFFGLAAIVVGVGATSGLLESMWVQSVSFAVVALVAVAFLRKPLSKRWTATEGSHSGEIVGNSVVLTEVLEPSSVGTAEFRGSTWSVRTAGAAPLASGTRCRVNKVEGLVLWVSPEPRPGAD